VGRLGFGPAECGAADPRAMQDRRQLARHGDLGALQSAPLGYLQPPAFERREACDPGEQHIRRLVKGRANHLVANTRDAAGHIGFAGLVSLRRQSKERSGIPGLLDPTRVIECRLVGDGDDCADT
jgi:hypothetical protein